MLHRLLSREIASLRASSLEPLTWTVVISSVTLQPRSGKMEPLCNRGRIFLHFLAEPVSKFSAQVPGGAELALLCRKASKSLQMFS